MRPDVTLYVASVIESPMTSTSLVRVAAGLEWLFSQFSRSENQPLPAVVSLSLGFPAVSPPDVTPAEYRARLDVLRVLLRTLVDANALPVVAIGNDGPGLYRYPAAFRQVIGVGAVDFGGQIARFSADGTPPREGVTKPDLFGYGVGVYSSVERDYSGASIYERMDGTSMATPYVAGVAALYRGQYPAWTVKEVWNKLTTTARPPSGQRPGTGGIATFVP